MTSFRVSVFTSGLGLGGLLVVAWFGGARSSRAKRSYCP